MKTVPTTVETAVSAVLPASRTGGLSAEARAAVEEGIPAETRRGYAGDWARFTAWCASTSRQALPATGGTLTEYMTHLKGEDKSPATMDRALASIAVAHAAAELPKPSTTGARRVLKGHETERKKSKDPYRRPRRAAAATPPVLRKMVTATDTATAIGRRDVAALLLGFALAARRSELRLLVPSYNILLDGHSHALENDVVINIKQAQTPAVSRHIPDPTMRDYFQHEDRGTVIPPGRSRPQSV